MRLDNDPICRWQRSAQYPSRYGYGYVYSIQITLVIISTVQIKNINDH